jgi:hypothetical protein
MLREGGLLRYLRDDEYILGDSGYLGEPQVVVLIENVISRIENWRCLSAPWRHLLDLHPLEFCIICQITNIDMLYRLVRVE